MPARPVLGVGVKCFDGARDQHTIITAELADGRLSGPPQPLRHDTISHLTIQSHVTPHCTQTGVHCYYCVANLFIY